MAEHEHTMSSEARNLVGNLDSRVVKVETKLDNVIAAISDLTSAVRQMANQPKSIAWREVVTTAATALGVIWYAGVYLEAQYAKNIAVEKYRIEQLERQIHLIAPLASIAAQGSR